MVPSRRVCICALLLRFRFGRKGTGQVKCAAATVPGIRSGAFFVDRCTTAAWGETECRLDVANVQGQKLSYEEEKAESVHGVVSVDSLVSSPPVHVPHDCKDAIKPRRWPPRKKSQTKTKPSLVSSRYQRAGRFVSNNNKTK